MTMMVITDINVMMTIKMMVAVLLIFFSVSYAD